MDISNNEDEKPEDFPPSTSLDSPKSKSKQSGISELFTTSYAELTKENIERMKLSNNSPKKYYLFDENEKLKAYRLVDPVAIENLTKMEQDFTLEEGLLVFLAAERFNDPTMAKLDGRTEEECVKIFTKIVNNPAIFNSLQSGFRELNSDQMHKLMFTLPFTEHEDSLIKKLNSQRLPTENELYNLQKDAFMHFRGRKAIATRYSQLWANNELDEQKYHNNSAFKENTILPFHDKFSATTLKYLTACATPELNGALNFASNLDALSRSHFLNNTTALGKLTLYKQVHDVFNDKISVFLSTGKLHFQQTAGRHVSYCSNICITFSNDNITFLNAFGVAVVINGTSCLPGQKATFLHKGTFIVAIPNFGEFFYTAGSKAISINEQAPLAPDVTEEAQNNSNKSAVDESKVELSQSSKDKIQNNGSQIMKAQIKDTSEIENKEIVEALRNFEKPSDEFDRIPIPYNLRGKARMRSIEGLPTSRPSDDNLLPAFVLYKYLTFNSSKSDLPCDDYVAFQRYLKDEMAEKVKLSKFCKSYSTSLSMAPMFDTVSGASSYNEQLQSLLPPSHIRPKKYANDLRFYTKNKNIIIEKENIEYYGQLRFQSPVLNPTKGRSNLPPEGTYLQYNDFECKYSLLNSFIPGVPKTYSYFAPKPKLVRNELGHPVWINVPEKPKPPSKQPAKRIKRTFQPLGTKPSRPGFQRPHHPRPQFTLHSAPQFTPSNTHILNDNSKLLQYAPPVLSASAGTITLSSAEDDGAVAGTQIFYAPAVSSAAVAGTLYAPPVSHASQVKTLTSYAPPVLSASAGAITVSSTSAGTITVSSTEDDAAVARTLTSYAPPVSSAAVAGTSYALPVTPASAGTITLTSSEDVYLVNIDDDEEIDSEYDSDTAHLYITDDF